MDLSPYLSFKCFIKFHHRDIKPKLLPCLESPTLIRCLVDPCSLYGFSSTDVIYRKCFSNQDVYRCLIFAPALRSI